MTSSGQATDEIFEYDSVREQLRAAYDNGAAERDRRSAAKPAWKETLRANFLERLQAEGKTQLLEIGAGTGQDSLFFQEHGLCVVATDLSAEMVRRCREKGLTAHQRDFLNLGFPAEAFDAVYAMNCLLHVPNADLPRVLRAIHAVMRPGALFFLGVYGGAGEEGIAPDDWHQPPRFFSWRTDEQIQQFVQEHFVIEHFRTLDIESEYHYQALTLRKDE